MTENADYFTLKATVIYVKQDSIAYPACLTEGCNKKVIEVDPGEWRCEKCNMAHPKPEYRYIMSINVSDHTGMLWLSCFDDVGRLIMNMPADEVMQIKDDGDDKRITEVFQDANCKTLAFRCRRKWTPSKISKGKSLLRRCLPMMSGSGQNADIRLQSAISSHECRATALCQ